LAEHVVGRAADLPPGTHRIVRAGNRELGLFNIDGVFHAIPNLCPHQRGPLCQGATSGTIDYGPHTDWKLAWIWDGEVVTCPWHGLEFHVPSGRCVAYPDVKLKTFDVVERNGDIVVVL
jgi:nitrite reductase/ring-hydroxylating ferredoxin subunit